MIDYIHGALTELTPTYAIIEAAGVGYEINIALSAFTSLSSKDGKDIKLFTTEIIREDAHLLFGFESKPEREVFLLLMTVSGIGANTARMIMSGYTIGELRNIIATGNAAAIARIKGIGAKTAQRVIVDLKDKILKIDFQNIPTDGVLPGDDFVADSENKTEAVSALAALGFNAAAAGKVVDKILKDIPAASVEVLIKQALKML